MCVGVSAVPLLVFVACILRFTDRLGEQTPASPRVNVVMSAFLATSPMWIDVPLREVRWDPVVVYKKHMKAGKRGGQPFLYSWKKMQINATTKTVRIAAAARIAPPMPDHVLEPLEWVCKRIWFLRGIGIGVRVGAITVCLQCKPRWRSGPPRVREILFGFFESPLRFPKYPRQPDLYVAQLQDPPSSERP